MVGMESGEDAFKAPVEESSHKEEPQPDNELDQTQEPEQECMDEMTQEASRLNPLTPLIMLKTLMKKRLLLIHKFPR